MHTHTTYLCIHIPCLSTHTHRMREQNEQNELPDRAQTTPAMHLAARPPGTTLGLSQGKARDAGAPF